MTARRTVVFDVGGVVVQWQPNALMRQCFPQQARDEAGALHVRSLVFQSFADGGDWAAFDRGTVEPAALAERIAQRSGLPHDGVTALIGAIAEHLQPMPQSVALIERVRAAGHRLALLSNMPRMYADHLEATHPLFGWFEHRAWSGRLGVIKPERAIFDHVREAAALDLAHAVFIDDHPGNIEAARQHGWQAIPFHDAAQCEAELRTLGWL